MRSWKILDVKKFMNIMLCREAFDTLLLAEASITGGVSYVIDGHLTEDFYSEQELEEMGLAGERCTTYGRVRPICFEMIKGKRTPRSFQVVFLAGSRLVGRVLEREGISMRPEDVANLSLNVRYHEGELYVTCGCTLRLFSMDRTLENAWADRIGGFLKKQEIAAEQTA